jgi:glycosyltransferase involved in cell wall biosynthesis
MISFMVLPVRHLFIVHSCPWAKLHPFYRKMLVTYLGISKRIVTVSNAAKETTIQKWALPNKATYIDVIYNTLPLPTKVKANMPDKVLRILTLGHVVGYKNPTYWIEVAKKTLENRDLSHLQIEFIWAGDGGMFKECRQRVKDLNLSHVHFIGYQENVHNLYQQTAIYFQPSLVESFGLSVLDAMSYGIPCVVSNIGGLPEVVTDNSTGYVVSVTEIETAVEKISLLLLNPSLRMQMGQLGKERYEKKFNLETWESSMLTLHQSI